MSKSYHTALKRISMNVKQLGDLLGENLSSAELHRVSVLLEGYSKIVEGYAINTSEQ